MVAVNKPRPSSFHRRSGVVSSGDLLFLLKGLLFDRKVARQAPIVGGLHRAVDGALIGVFIAVTLMSGLMLYWQHLWTVAFRKLESTRELTHKLTESTALIEQHLREDLSNNLLAVEQAASGFQMSN